MIREAREGDLEVVLRIERASETAPHWGEEEYRRILRGDGPVRRCLLVADLGRVVGFAVGVVVAELGELESVAVEAGARRQGSGRALCAAVIEWCRGVGAKAVELEVRAASGGARRLYEGLGFRQVGARRAYYSAPVDDAVLLRIELE
jgi:ribosomal-protein-alanine N-acetyltransferase